MEEQISVSSEIILGGVKVELTWIGEGYSGDYDETDSEDKPLLRLYVSKKNSEGLWEDVEDGSACTLIGAYTDQTRVDELAHTIFNRVYWRVNNELSIKKVVEELSWFSD